MDNAQPILVVMPVMPVWVLPSGKVGLTAKFVEGMDAYAAHWPGRVHAVMHPWDTATENLDTVKVDPANLSFDLTPIRFDAPELGHHLMGASVILAGADYLQNRVVTLGKSQQIPVVYTTECTLKTRRQIVASEEPQLVKRLKRTAWETREEGRRRRAIKQAQGLQANGVPTFEAYRALTPAPLLFFDNRTREDEMITSDQLDRRLTQAEGGGPLRLAFTGRLHPIKGADDLVGMASRLRAMGVDFTLSIAGGGPDEARLKEMIGKEGLGDRVFLRGVMPFREKLLPWLHEHVDLFICCHRQGDPSCTYIETLSCGIPIVGYDNEAFAGLMRHADVGWQVPMNNIEALTKCVETIGQDRSALIAKSRAARQFALNHSFEKTFKSRVEHLITVAGVRHD